MNKEQITKICNAWEEVKDTLIIGSKILKEIRKDMGVEEYDRIMSDSIKGCKCGFIKEGDSSFCPKCEEIR